MSTQLCLSCLLFEWKYTKMFRCAQGGVFFPAICAIMALDSPAWWLTDISTETSEYSQRFENHTGEEEGHDEPRAVVPRRIRPPGIPDGCEARSWTENTLVVRWGSVLHMDRLLIPEENWRMPRWLHDTYSRLLSWRISLGLRALLARPKQPACTCKPTLNLQVKRGIW